MSLLIKALQKAEQSKNGSAEAAATGAAAAPAELELAPHHPSSMPDLREEAGFEAPAPVHPSAAPAPTPATAQPASKPAARSQQQAAAAVFAAKQDESGDEGMSRALTMGLIGIAFLLLVGGGFYFYLDSLSQPEIVATRPLPTPPKPVLPAAPVVPSAPVEATAVAVPVAPPVPASPAAMPAVVQPEPAAALAQAPAQPAPAEAAAAPAAAQPRKTAAPAEEEGAVKVTRSRNAAPSVNSHVLAGYQAFSAGNDAAAAQAYRKALQSEPRNTDALLGLAAVSARQGENEQAAAYFMQVLEADPRNASAQAGLIALSAQTDAQAAESRLKQMLVQQPEAAFLHASLGNLYADQERWPAAQQAYFEAYRLESENPEYAFNLAVSLDHMGKANLAAQHYERALQLMQQRGGAGLDRAQIESRIAQLRPTGAE